MTRKFLPIFAAIAILLSACGAQGTPTLTPEEVQGTAVAAAWTMVAMTQEAIPTNTPVPPTETPSPTPLPTFTPEPLPTQEFIFPTATQAASGDDSCLKPLNVAEAGPRSNVRFENETGGKVTLSLNLRTNAFAQCGALVYTLARNEKLVVSLPKGEYFAYAWIEFPNGSTGNSSGSFVNKPADNHLFPVHIRAEVIISK